MKVLVDTSAWVDFLNGYPSKERAALASLIASVILFAIDTLAYQLMVDWLPLLWSKL